MTTRPLIGITGRRTAGAALGVPHGFADAPVDAYLSEYALSVHRAGGIPVHLPLGAGAVEALDRLDGLLLSGGEDVDPRRYGSVPGPMSTDISPDRDAEEIGLVHRALELGLPLAGVCRGLQLINVARGGSLIAHLAHGEGESHGSYAYPRRERVHRVSLAAGSLAAELYGGTASVNSFHHQAIDRPGIGLRVTAHAPDGVAEAIELPGVPLLGVQWHPEVFEQDPLFDWIVAAAGSRHPEAQRRAAHPHHDLQEA